MNQSQKTSNGRNRVSIFELCLSLFFILVIETWLVRAEIILPNKGIFLYGFQAQSISALLIVVSAYPFIRQIGIMRAHRKRIGFLVSSALTACGIIGCVAPVYPWPMIVWFIVPVLFLWGVINGFVSSLSKPTSQ